MAYSTNHNCMEDLPEYTVRISKRAKYPRLTMSIEDGLIVVVPRGYSHQQIPSLIRSRLAWIERSRALIESRRRMLESEPSDGLPVKIDLRAIDEEWKVVYRETSGSQARALESNCEPRVITVYGNTGSAEGIRHCRLALRSWLFRKAGRELIVLLERVSAESAIGFTGASVRCQKTRWGSCSAKGSINLNVKLLFLPADLCRHVLLHELCHRVHLNHSPYFWATLKRYSPDYLEKEAQLKTAFRFVPSWADKP